LLLARTGLLTRRPTVALTTASDVQAALDANPTGTTFKLAAGTYRPTTNYPNSGLAPKAHQRLIGAAGGGAVLSGAKLLTSWTPSGSDFWATRASGTVASKPDDPGDGNRCNITGCENPNDVFYDGGPLQRVASQGALATGKFFEDFGAGRVYIRDDPSGHTVEQAVAPNLVKSANAGVRVSNFVVQMAANLSQTGAISADGTGWLIDHNDIRYNHGHGVHGTGSGTLVARNKIHHQMQMGIGGEGDDLVVEYNEIYENNRDGSYLKGWEAGGTKWALGDRLRLRNNWSHDNHGIGFWCDINLGNVIIEDNYVHDNEEWGIFYEIAFGEVTSSDGLKTHIRNNVSFDNYPTGPQGFYTGGQIVVSGSPDVEVYGNTVRGQDGIGGLAQLRTDHSDPRGAHELRNLHVYDNDIEQVHDGVGWGVIAGIACDDANQIGTIFASEGNTFENNRYFIADTRSAWDWDDNFRDWAYWQGDGNDDSGGGGSRTVGGTVTIPGTPTLAAGPQ
jgi:hypothetical protein